MEFSKRTTTAGGVYVEIRIGVWRCQVCGEIYFGVLPPSNCPYCGSQGNYMVAPEAFDQSVDHVRRTDEADLANLRQSVQAESEDAGYYAQMSRRQMPCGFEHLQKIFSRLSEVEKEHCELFSRLLNAKMPENLDGAGVRLKEQLVEDLEFQMQRERKANELYFKFASQTKDERLRKVWMALQNVELEHHVTHSRILDDLK